MSRVGCFVLHLRCDEPSCSQGGEPVARDEFTGENRGEAMRAAKRAGWVFSDPEVVPSHDRCPSCEHRRLEVAG